MGRIVAISNRTASDPRARAGGLAVAVWEALKSSGGAWFGWSGDLVDEPRGVNVFDSDGVEFNLVDITEEEFDGYYVSYSNRVLWPIFHYRTDLSNFDSQAFDIYAAVNQRIAKAAASRLRPDDVVWVHDYHFLLMADCLRRAGWNGPVGFFLHIPFPPPEIFRALPEHRWLAQALCQYDVVGFQSEQDRGNFVRYLIDDCDGEELADGKVSVFNRKLKVAAYPIGIDAAGFVEASQSAAATQAAGRIQAFLGERAFVIGVDRMDYSKGLPERFAAVGAFFKKFPAMIGKVSVTQIAPPSRSKVEEYQELREQLDELAGRINGDYGDLDWIPLRYLARSYGRDELAGLFRIARVCLVTPLRDGMNLVSKEFVMAQDPADPGVLVLSEFAGAAEQLKDALIVNPHNKVAVAETIHQALTMPLDERVSRWKSLKTIIEEHDIAWWRETFLRDLRAV